MEAEIIASIADVTRLVRRAFDARARVIGVTRPQWQVLSLIKRNGGINQGGLADLLDVEPITVGRMIDRLQEAELVERRPDPADRRAWRLHLTEKADALVEDLRPLAEDLFQETFEGLDTQQRDLLKATLDHIRQNLSRRGIAKAAANG